MTDREEAPSISFPAPPEFLKVDRSTMGQFVVETELCQLILSRVLEVIRQRDVLPFTISTCRNKKVQIIEMELVAFGWVQRLASLPARTRGPEIEAISASLRDLTDFAQGVVGKS